MAAAPTLRNERGIGQKLSLQIEQYNSLPNVQFRVDGRKIGEQDGRNVYVYRATMTNDGYVWGYGLTPDAAIIAYLSTGSVDEYEALADHLYRDQSKFGGAE